MTSVAQMSAHLGQFITDHKKELVEQVLSKRTRALTVAIENVYQSHNASAVIRSADCFGVQDIHIIENENKYEINPDVTLGSNQWVTLYHYNEYENNTEVAIENLKSKGYRIVCTSPRGNVSLDEYEIKGKSALLFGTELHGLSKTAMKLADDEVFIPMYGFTESFNISVSAALCLSAFRLKLENSGVNYGLTEIEKEELRFEWYKSIVRNSDKIIERFVREIENEE